MIGLHGPVEVIGPLVAKWEEVECHGLTAIDDLFALVGEFSLFGVEGELAIADGNEFFHDDRAIRFSGGLEVLRGTRI